ncbi:uncharacterized protein LOC125943877 [Dermacentor silvarum]|uniref:uncharacterized protein LOC125943831 n=1 Tax=Dermacentor silvarum TaxID=543639 RepID=UPI002101B2B7|nr:uncharacterized protein LOC125943831 [Dermacentor silvarum]XP_049519393.1 uncharacterized protein LOC125943877 [Dermacentor silvarum]
MLFAVTVEADSAALERYRCNLLTKNDFRMQECTVRLFILCLTIAAAAPAGASSQLGPVTGFIADLFNNIIEVVDAGIKEGLNLVGHGIKEGLSLLGLLLPTATPASAEVPIEQPQAS